MTSLKERAERWLKAYERDEVALTAECLEELLQKVYLDAVEQVPVELAKALAFYSDPETYSAWLFLADPPSGPFGSDFSDTPLGRKPGRRAREVLDRVVAEMGPEDVGPFEMT